jgi:pimeloyl-ACP methyl ester carboxylesterase
MDAARVAIRSNDGIELAAHRLPSDRHGPGVVIVHGLGSRADNHLDFAAHAAERGVTALAIDIRGHGESIGVLGPGALDDVIAAVDALRAEGHDRVGIRGSSLGGFLALHAAERHPAVRAVVALCPATATGLSRRLKEDWPLEIGELRERDLRPGVARGYWHARGDEQVAWGDTFALATRSPAPRHLRVAMGGSHRSLQHDPEVLADSADFLARVLGA